MYKIESHLQRLVNGLIAKPALASVLLGILSASGFNFELWWSLVPTIIGFSGYLMLQRVASNQRPFLLGWLFGLGHLVAGWYWIGNALITSGLWYLYPLGVIGLPLLYAPLVGLMSVLTFKVRDYPCYQVLLFALLWSASEWVRGHAFTGFPWNLTGYIWDQNLLQMTSLIGIYGLSLLTIVFLTAFASQNKKFILLMVLGGVLGEGWGWYRLQHTANELTGINMRLVQASIPQNQKWVMERFEQNLDKHLALSLLEAEKPLAMVIWPEASVPTVVDDYQALRETLAQAVPENGYLVIGAPRQELRDGQRIYFTSQLVLNQQGQLVATYDKSHLVPFGEFMPFKSIINLKKITAGVEDYHPGTGLRTINLPHVPPFSPLICYEAIFSSEVAQPDARPEWLLNQTNDAWYGHTSGPYQHLKNVSVRAIEEGLPLVRCANNGITAVVDPCGRIMYRLELDEVGFIDFDLPKPLPSLTLFARYGHVHFYTLFILLFMVVVGLELHRRRGVTVSSLTKNHS